MAAPGAVVVTRSTAASRRIVMGPVYVRDLVESDLDAAVRLHQVVMSSEFLAGCGGSFLRAYYRVWMRSPAAIALAAVDDDDEIVGLLLGSVDPGLHYRSMVRRGWFSLAARLAFRALSRPPWGVELLQSRGVRYVRALLRMVPRIQRLGVSSAAAEAVVAAPVGEPRVAEITHLMVAPSTRGQGAGRRLVEEACRRARTARAARVVVVTPPGWAAEVFYAHLGWERVGELTSASDERFVRYELPLPVAAVA